MDFYENMISDDDFDLIDHQNSKSKEILHFLIDVDKKEIEYTIIKSLMLNPKIYITEYKTQLEVIIAIFLYLSKSDSYYHFVRNNLYYFVAVKRKID